MDVEQHLIAFVTAFVTPARRERWLQLFTRRRKNVFANSSKLMQHLDERYCVQVDGAWDLDPSRQGVYYDFYNEPIVKTLAEAVAEGDYHNAIFSLEPGQLAIHFSHEGWSWLCHKEPPRTTRCPRTSIDGR